LKKVPPNLELLVSIRTVLFLAAAARRGETLFTKRENNLHKNIASTGGGDAMGPEMTPNQKPQATQAPPSTRRISHGGEAFNIIMFARTTRILPALLLPLLLLLTRPDRALSLLSSSSSSSFRPSMRSPLHNRPTPPPSSPLFSPPIRLPHDAIHRPTTTTTTTTTASSILPPRRPPLHSTSSGSVEEGGIAISSTEGEEETPLLLAMAVGVVSSLVGYAYSKCMKAGFELLWKTVPSSLLLQPGAGGAGGCSSGSGFGGALLNGHPAAYIPIVVALGGTTVAVLSTLFFPKLFSAHDMVRVLSREDGGPADVSRIPSARGHLLPVMALCCLTSISGFSLGPEAPMVRVSRPAQRESLIKNGIFPPRRIGTHFSSIYIYNE